MRKTIVITGTSTGFGKLMVQQLATQGHNVVATMRGISDKNLAVAQELAAIKNVFVKEIDVTKQDSINKAIEETIKEFGKIDVLVNNAGVYGGGLQEAYSINQVQNMFDVNVYGPLRMNQAVLPQMRQVQDGLVINISSLMGLVSMPGSSIYSASKFALEGLVIGSYGELIEKGVENVLIEPGAFPTEISQKSGVYADLEEVTASYDGLYEQINEKTNQNMATLMEQKQPNPQDIADKVHELINMEKGKRPVHNVVCALCGPEICQEFEDDKATEIQKVSQAYA